MKNAFRYDPHYRYYCATCKILSQHVKLTGTEALQKGILQLNLYEFKHVN